MVCMCSGHLIDFIALSSHIRAASMNCRKCKGSLAVCCQVDHAYRPRLFNCEQLTSHAWAPILEAIP